VAASSAEYDDVVIGAGAGGLTAALLLARLGRRVALVEKSGDIGGSLARFRCRGHEFDSGFHFTGGLQPGGVLSDMLRVLGLREEIRAVPLLAHGGHLIHIESEGRTYELPVGAEAFRRQLHGYFPAEQAAVDSYWQRMVAVCQGSPATDLRALRHGVQVTEEDKVTLGQALDGLTGNATLKALLGLLCMCHGSGPAEISFANHSRVALALHDSVTRVDGGGQAIVEAFRRALRAHHVDVLCGRTVQAFTCSGRRRSDQLTLSAGEVLRFENVVWTLHPRAILDSLPGESVTPAFRERVLAFRPSVGIFAVFAVLRDDHDIDWTRTLVTLLPDPEVDRLLGSANDGDGGLVIMGGDPEPGTGAGVLHVLESTPVEQVAAWQASSTGCRPEDYHAYKLRRARRILERLDAWKPGFADRIDVVATASALTFRDYLNSPDGSAYGVRQQVGQISLFGRLPMRNMYAAGQSAVLPGLVGTMMASFAVCRTLVGPDVYDEHIERALAS
jgi:phytoene dehydrogenase-like protein